MCVLSVLWVNGLDNKITTPRHTSHSLAKFRLYWFRDWYENRNENTFLFLQLLKSLTVFVKVRAPDRMKNINCKCSSPLLGSVCVFSIFKCPKYDGILTRECGALTRSGHWPGKPGLEAWFTLMWLADSPLYWAAIGCQQWYTRPSGLAWPGFTLFTTHHPYFRSNS